MIHLRPYLCAFGGAPGAPPAPPPVPAAAAPPTFANPAVSMAGAKQRQAAAAAAGAGFAGTLTNTGGAQGQINPPTTKGALLG